MKYTYAYKTSDGTRHEATMNASSREEVFVALREKGIKAIKVVAHDGSKANGEVRGIRKNVVFLIACAVAVVSGIAVYLIFSGDGSMKDVGANVVRSRNAAPLPRQMIPGDRERVKSAATMFDNAAERYLSLFAEPGRPLPEAKVTVPPESEFIAILHEPIKISENEFTESVDLKRIVSRIKADMRRYLSAGGNVKGYVSELIKRQEKELEYRERALSRIDELLSGDTAKAYDYYLKANAQLQSMGIYPIGLPEKLRGYQTSLNFDE